MVKIREKYEIGLDTS